MKIKVLLAVGVMVLAGCSKPQAPAERGEKPEKAPAEDTAPATFRVNLDTSRGAVVIGVTRVDAPLGADRFYSLVKSRFYDGARFFRVVPGFVVQFGIAADPKATRAWDVKIKDDPIRATNDRGSLSFATSGPDTRTTQMFINLGENGRLDAMGFSAFGKVVSGMDVVDKIYSGDGEKPDQHRIEEEGNSYLEKDFPNLDYIKTARIAQ